MPVISSPTLKCTLYPSAVIVDNIYVKINEVISKVVNILLSFSSPLVLQTKEKPEDVHHCPSLLVHTDFAGNHPTLHKVSLFYFTFIWDSTLRTPISEMTILTIIKSMLPEHKENLTTLAHFSGNSISLSPSTSVLTDLSWRLTPPKMEHLESEHHWDKRLRFLFSTAPSSAARSSMWIACRSSEKLSQWSMSTSHPAS